MAARLKSAGFKDTDVRLFGVSDHPREDGLVATLNGTDPRARAILLLAHLDVVEAKREDWTRDPFVLVEVEWLLLRPWLVRRQGPGCDFHGYAGPSETDRNETSSASETGVDLW